MHLPRALALAALIGLGSISCNKGETPEQRVRALIVEAEQAVEKKEIANVRGYVSARYRDDEQRDRRAIEGILRLYLLRHESINLYTRIESIIPTQADHAEAGLCGHGGAPDQARRRAQQLQRHAVSVRIGLRPRARPVARGARRLASGRANRLRPLDSGYSAPAGTASGSTTPRAISFRIFCP